MHVLAYKISVIQNIAVGEGCAFRVAGSATGELDVDGVIGVQPALDNLQLRKFSGAPELAYGAKVMHAGTFFAAHSNHVFEMRQFFRDKRAGLAVFKLRRQGLQHL